MHDENPPCDNDTEVTQQNKPTAAFRNLPQRQYEHFLSTDILGPTIDETILTSIETIFELCHINCDTSSSEKDEDNLVSGVLVDKPPFSGISESKPQATQTEDSYIQRIHSNVMIPNEEAEEQNPELDQVEEVNAEVLSVIASQSRSNSLSISIDEQGVSPAVESKAEPRLKRHCSPSCKASKGQRTSEQTLSTAEHRETSPPKRKCPCAPPGRRFPSSKDLENAALRNTCSSDKSALLHRFSSVKNLKDAPPEGSSIRDRMIAKLSSTKTSAESPLRSTSRFSSIRVGSSNKLSSVKEVEETPPRKPTITEQIRPSITQPQRRTSTSAPKERVQYINGSETKITKGASGLFQRMPPICEESKTEVIRAESTSSLASLGREEPFERQEIPRWSTQNVRKVDKQNQTSFGSLSEKRIQTSLANLQSRQVQTSATLLNKVLVQIKSAVMPLPEDPKYKVKSVPTQTDITLPLDLMVDLGEQGCKNYKVTCHDRNSHDKDDMQLLRRLGINDSKRIAKINIGPLCLCPSGSDKSSDSAECSCGTVHYKIGCNCKGSSSTSSKEGVGDAIAEDYRKTTVAPALLQAEDETPKDVRYAITKITRYNDFTTYEVMKSTHNVPKVIPKFMEGIFVLRKRGGINRK